jgi:uncharacterized protein
MFARSLAVLVAVVASASAADLKFEVYKDKAGDTWWRLKDGDTLLGNSGQGYAKKADAVTGVERMQKDAGDEKKLAFEVYEDNAKKYRWRAKVKNGNTVAAGTKGYDKKEEAEAVVKLIQDKAAKAELVEVKERSYTRGEHVRPLAASAVAA